MNTIMLKHDDEVEVIILTNEETEVIEQAINEAYNKWQNQGTFPQSQLDFTLEYLKEIYGVEYSCNVTEISY